MVWYAARSVYLFGLATVQIGIDEQAELSCANIENSGALVNALKSATGL